MYRMCSSKISLSFETKIATKSCGSCRCRRISDGNKIINQTKNQLRNYACSSSFSSNQSSSSLNDNIKLERDKNNSNNKNLYSDDYTVQEWYDDWTQGMYSTIPQYGNGVTIGQYACMKRKFRINDIMNFSSLSGDRNPLHEIWTSMDEIPDIVSDHPLLEWEDNDSSTLDQEQHQIQQCLPEHEKRSKVLVHGMLVSSMFTCIFGTLVPGSVYMKQNIIFKKPVYANDKVLATITINKIRKFPSNSSAGGSSTAPAADDLQQQRKIRSGLIVSCSTNITSIPSKQYDSDEGNTPVIEYVKGDAIVWMTRGVELEKTKE
jgi:hypothetical protein